MTDSDRIPQRDFARQLRRSSSMSERRLWLALRDRRLGGLKFRRQYAIDRYTVDFACPQKRLTIEIDGHSHTDRGDYGKRRESEIRSLGWNVVRALNDDIRDNLEGVLVMIAKACGLDEALWLSGGLGQLPEGLE